MFSIIFFRNVPIEDGIPVARSPMRDWDAPQLQEENPEAYEVPQAIRRKRRLIARDGSVSPPAETMKYDEMEDDDPWKKKSKIPKYVFPHFCIYFFRLKAIFFSNLPPKLLIFFG